jgi:hypothetical protein
MPEPGAATLCPVPILLIVFNRPATTRRVLDRIAQARPVKLLVVADGPRRGRAGEEAVCREVRDIVSSVDWPCEVLTNFSACNLGCGQRIVTGLDWAFSLVEEAIILEDDCLPDASFFPFCQELLERYRGDARIAAISGTNLVERHVNVTCDYYFSRLGGIWGWATWRSQWQGYDRYLRSWPDLRRSRALAEMFDRPKDIAFWTRIFDAMFEGRGPDTWDYQWVYTNLFGNKLTVVPRVNLIMNIGFGTGATNTGNADARLMPTLKAIKFPLKHPSAIIPSRSLDHHFQKLYELSLLRRIEVRLGRAIGNVRRVCQRVKLHLSERQSHQKRGHRCAATLPGSHGKVRRVFRDHHHKGADIKARDQGIELPGVDRGQT